VDDFNLQLNRKIARKCLTLSLWIITIIRILKQKLFSLFFPFPHFFFPENIHYLVSSTLSSFAAIVRTDGDKTVVVSTLETLEEILKPLKTLNFLIGEKEVSNLMVSIQDVLDNKVKGGKLLVHVVANSHVSKVNCNTPLF